MKPIDADALEIDMEETVFDGDGTYKVYGYSSYQIKRAPTITPPPNDPLTLDELREMDREPVWVCNPADIRWGHYALVRNDRFDGPEYNYCAYAVGVSWSFSDYGKTWLAYRRKPEEGTV